MADGVTYQSTTPATPAAGTIAATDDAGAAGHVQIVKLAISTDGSATAIPADASNGIDVDVTRLPALVAGTANIGDVDVLTIAAGDNNIGNVDIVTMPNVTNAGTFAVQESGAALTALQLIDDTVATLGTTTYTEASTKGNTIAAVRRDADTTLVDTTNEIGPLQMDANGRLKVEAFSGETLPVSLTSTTVTGTVAVTQSGTWDEVGINDSGNSITVDNGGTFVTQENGALLTSAQLIDDIVYTDDTSTHSTGSSKGALIMAAATPTDTSVNANDIGAVAMTTDRRLLVDASGVAVPVTDNSGSLTVDYATTGSGTATGALRVELPTNGTGVIATVSAVTAITNALPAGTNNIGDVDVLTIAAGDNNIGNVDIVTMPNVTLAAGTNTNEVVGDIAHDTGVGGNPVLIAGSAQDMDDTAPPNQVSAESDTTRLAVDRDGALFVRPFGPRIWSYHLDTSTAQTDTSVHSAPASGLSLYVTDIIFSSDGTAAINIFFEEGATKVLGPFYLPATAGGVKFHFATPKKITAATALTVTTSASHAHAIEVTGFTAQG